MVDSWRPEGWSNPASGDPYDDYGNGFEAGADAMLEALKVKGTYLTGKGWTVFIED